MKKWGALLVLGAAQFLMVLDTSVMNVSISQLVEDFDTDVTQIQFAITFYALVMAALMIVGGKLGDVIGRRRAFGIGMAIYGIGSAVTAISWSVPMLVFGWSVLEGIGAALVLPAMAALIGTNYSGKDRATAFGLIGGLSGVGVAVGPLLGGWVTTNLTWRVVFVGEVVVAVLIIACIGLIAASPKSERRPQIDWVGALLSALGLGLIVWGALQSSQWGFISPRNSPIEPFGFALTPFVIATGAALIYGFVRWQRFREDRGDEPLIHLRLFKNASLSSGLTMSVAQSVILAGVFFAIPLYLQVVIGLDAFDTGVRMVPVSVALLLFSIGGSQLMLRYSPRFGIRIAIVIIFVANGILLGLVQPELDNTGFFIAMALLGAGIGLMAAVLGNQIQSAVTDRDRSEAGGLQNSATQLGTALGTAVIGAILISGLASSFLDEVADNPQVPDRVEQAVEVSLARGVSFISSEEVRALTDADGETPPEITEAIVSSYESAQLDALKAAFLANALVLLIAFIFTRQLPTRKLGEIAAGGQEEVAVSDTARAPPESATS